MTTKLPTSLPKLKGYIRVFRLYISYGRVLALLTAVLLAAAAYSQTLHPQLVGLWIKHSPMPKLLVNSLYMEGYSGLARLVSESGELIYEGRLEDGTVTGHGKLWSKGALIYEGSFSDAKYSGRGKLYDGQGRIIYEGEFSGNMYNGSGALFGPDGETLYEGGFLEGEKSGFGVAYLNGSVIYEGMFEDGVYSGEGKKYSGGLIIYEGGFSDGEYDGTGREYEDGGLVYEGSFSRGLREGEGTQYAGKLPVYEGLWSGGKYNGAGKLYSGRSLIYEGEFSEGIYNGEGSEYYPETGFLKYEGRFLEGKYLASGTRYDEKGRPIVSIPLIVPSEVIGMPYPELLELLKDAGLDFREMELDNSPVVLAESVGFIFALSRDMKGGVPGYVKTVYCCALSEVKGALTGMLLKDVISVLGPPEEPGKILPGASDILALTISNGIWGRDIDSNGARGAVFVGEELKITAFYDNTGEEPGDCLFFAVSMNTKGK